MNKNNCKATTKRENEPTERCKLTAEKPQDHTRRHGSPKMGFKKNKCLQPVSQSECVGVGLLCRRPLSVPWVRRETDSVSLEMCSADLSSWYHRLEGEAARLKGPLTSFRSDAEQLFEVCRQLRTPKGPVEWISHNLGLTHFHRLGAGVH